MNKLFAAIISLLDNSEHGGIKAPVVKLLETLILSLSIADPLTVKSKSIFDISLVNPSHIILNRKTLQDQAMSYVKKLATALENSSRYMIINIII